MLADFDAIATGLVNGVPIARQGRKTWTFVLLLVKSDEEVKVQEFGMTSYNGAHGNACHDCLCNAGSRPWTDLSRLA